MDDLGPSPEQQAYEAREVQLLLSKDAVKDAWAATERRIVNEWRRAPTVGERELCRAKLDVFEIFKAELRGLSERTPLHLAKE